MDMTNTTTTLASLLLGSFLLAGCSQVKPQVDFARTRHLIEESTGVPVAYDPDEPPLTKNQLDAMLTDGLSLDDALHLSLLNNRGLQRAFMEIGVRNADWVQSGLLSNPTLGLSLQFPGGGGRTNFQAALAQNIVDLWQIPTRKRQTQKALDETVLRIARLAGELTADAKSAYFKAVAAKEQLTVARENLELVQKSYDAIKAQREVGTASPLDQNLARGQVLAAELTTRNARLEMANAKRRLGKHLSLGRNIDELALTDTLPEMPPESLEPERLVDLARTTRLDLRALAASTESARAKLKLEHQKVFPNVSLGILFERTDQPPSSGGTTAADLLSSALTGETPMFNTGGDDPVVDTITGPTLSMTLPIFDQNQAQIARSHYLYVQTLRAFENLYLNVAQDIRISFDASTTAFATVAFFRDQVLPQSEKNLEFARTSYTAGQASILALLDAQRFLLEARRGYISVRLEAATALSDLERAVGLPVQKMGEISSAPEDG